MKFNWFFLSLCLLIGCNSSTIELQSDLSPGDPLDSLNHVIVFYNGDMNHVDGRNTTNDGYNLGLKYQCVEFVKRYYYEHLNHKMPDSYGHAKDFFNPQVIDGARNEQRNLIQFSNGSSSKPKVDDLVVFAGTMFNSYGHVAIVSSVSDQEIEVFQQNVGYSSRQRFELKKSGRSWRINQSRVLGWLRKLD